MYPSLQRMLAIKLLHRSPLIGMHCFFVANLITLLSCSAKNRFFCLEWSKSSFVSAPHFVDPAFLTYGPHVLCTEGSEVMVARGAEAIPAVARLIRDSIRPSSEPHLDAELRRE